MTNQEFYPWPILVQTLTVRRANSGPNTNGTQFFITEVPKPNLDNRHSVFGELVIGLDIQDSISNVKTDRNDKPIEDVIIEELNIIRKGKAAKKFDAPNIFMDSLAAAERRAQEKIEKAAAILKATQDKFKALKEKAITLPSGLKYIITEKGTGEKLPETAELSTHYAVYFEDGKILETSKLEIAEALDIVNESRKAQNGYQPITAEIGPDARMIAGFKEGLQQLSVGDKATLFIPYHLAYGESGTRGIPGKSNMVFEAGTRFYILFCSINPIKEIPRTRSSNFFFKQNLTLKQSETRNFALKNKTYATTKI